ncbi:MAG: two-component system sensor histidine kinase/response regulator, partial [Paraglaciecola sp.]
HKLKSSARSVGALALGELCEEMEQAAKTGKLKALTVLLPRFEAEMTAVIKYLDVLLVTDIYKNR